MRGSGKALQVLAVLDPDDGAVLGWMFRCRRCGGYALGARADMLDAAAAHCHPPQPAGDGAPRGAARGAVRVVAGGGRVPARRVNGDALSTQYVSTQ